MPNEKDSTDDIVSADIAVSIDGLEVSALVDREADFWIVTKKLADKLWKVKTEWTTPFIRSAGAQLLAPTGKCTARIGKGNALFVGTFVILPECWKYLILGMGLLSVHGAVIKIHDSVVAFTTDPADSSDIELPTMALCIANNGVHLPPRSCLLLAVQC